MKNYSNPFVVIIKISSFLTHILIQIDPAIYQKTTQSQKKSE